MSAGGWQARLTLDFAQGANGRTILAKRSHQGPLVVQRPFYPEGSPCHCYLLHPPGGVVGGDDLALHLTVGPTAHALLTTPGATKFYRSAGPLAQQQQWLHVAENGILEWLPQENIFFSGTHARLVTRFALASHARVLGWEVHALGRPANQEPLLEGSVDLLLDLQQQGRPLLQDRLRIYQGQGLTGSSGLRGWPVTGTAFAIPAGPEELAAVRQLTLNAEGQWGATLLDDLLVVRCLTSFTEPLRQLFTTVWSLLRPRILQRPACLPGIWKC